MNVKQEQVTITVWNGLGVDVTWPVHVCIVTASVGSHDTLVLCYSAALQTPHC